MSQFSGVVFALDCSHQLGASVAEHLGVALANHEEREFAAGEHKTRPLVSVRGHEVYVIASLAGDDELSANDKLCRLLFFIGALKDASAANVTAVVPYLCYSRKDRRTKARDPVTTRYVAQLFEAVGTDRVMTVDVHNLAAFQNSFRCTTEHLEATELFVKHIANLAREESPVIVSPDIGGVKRAERIRHRLSDVLSRPVDLAMTEKHRSKGEITGADHVLGDVEGRAAMVVDDLIGSGATMLRVADMLRVQGATSVHLFATHGQFSQGATALFETDSVDSLVITDTINPTNEFADRLTTLKIGPLLADAIARIHRHQSISELLQLET